MIIILLQKTRFFLYHGRKWPVRNVTHLQPGSQKRPIISLHTIRAQIVTPPPPCQHCSLIEMWWPSTKHREHHQSGPFAAHKIHHPYIREPSAIISPCEQCWGILKCSFIDDYEPLVDFSCHSSVAF